MFVRRLSFLLPSHIPPLTMSTTHHHHQRSNSPEPATITKTNSPPALPSLPTPGLLLSVAEGAHYSGLPRHSPSERRRASLGPGVSEDSLSPSRQRVLEDVKDLFCGIVSVESLQRSWHDNAVFEDPLSIARGFREVAAQWFALHKLFPKIERLGFRVLSNTTRPNRMICTQRQEYTMRFFHTAKVVESLIIIELDENDKIIKLKDKWNGDDLPSRWGAGLFRRLNAKAIGLFFGVKKPKN